jgi:hypothetical protein
MRLRKFLRRTRARPDLEAQISIMSSLKLGSFQRSEASLPTRKKYPKECQEKEEYSFMNGSELLMKVCASLPRFVDRDSADPCATAPESANSPPS